jgi:hypothetical protein
MQNLSTRAGILVLTKILKLEYCNSYSESFVKGTLKYRIFYQYKFILKQYKSNILSNKL